jgi:perosamine synthetase
VIRLASPDIGPDDLAAVAAVLKSGYLVQGAQVRAFEERFAEAVGTRHAIAVANCTAALHLALLALHIGPGDRVAVPAYSFLSTANVVVLCGAEPVFVDIEPCGFGMDPEALRRALQQNRVAAVMPVHALGAMASISEIATLAAGYSIPVVEDAACALGASAGARQAGTWGRVGCFSFHPRKAITTGEGGMLVTDDATMARCLRILRNHGLDPDAPSPDFVAAGFNLRMTEFQAALGMTQLAKLARLVEIRRAQARRYDALFANTRLVTPQEPPGTRHVFQSYAVLLPTEAARQRGALIAALRERGIETTLGTYHMPLTTYFRGRGGYKPGDFPVTDDVAGRSLSLPLHTQLTAPDQERVASQLLAAIA